jgi:hypothetical protein
MSGERLLARLRALFVAVCMLTWITSHAQSQQLNATCSGAAQQSGLLNEIHTVEDPSVGVASECTFTVSVAGTYQVALTDIGSTLGSPAVAWVKLGITSGTTLVGTTLTTAPGSMQFPATPGTYVIRVVGAPATDTTTSAPLPGSGLIGIKVTNVQDSSVLASFSSSLAPTTVTGFPATEANIDDSFTVTADGSYVVTLADLQIPQTLKHLTLVVTTDDGTFVTNPALTTTTGTPTVSATVTLKQGVNYRVLAGGLADTTVNAGLFSATVAPSGGGAPAYSQVVTIGTVSSVATVTLTTGASYTLGLSDLSYPAALGGLQAFVVYNNQVVAQLTAAGTSPAFTAAAGNYQVFALPKSGTAADGTTATAGSYAVSLNQQGGSPALSTARAVSPPTGTTPTAYSYDASVSTAGTYAFDLADFGFPTSFASLSAVVVQGGAVIGQPLKTAGTQNVTLAAGPVSVLVYSQPGTAGGMFGTDLTASGATPIFETTRGVGALFTARQVNITSAGNYAVNVADVKFPSALSTFAVIVTRGSTQIGSIFGGGAFLLKNATTGNYFVNFIATPNSTDKSGTYALSVAPGPSVNLQSDATTVATGGIVHLNWTSANADSCTASDGWSGPQQTSGKFTSSALTATTKFTLTCAGEGTSDQGVASVTVTSANPPSGGGGGGGGGAVTTDVVLILLGLVAHRASRRLLHPFVTHAP